MGQSLHRAVKEGSLAKAWVCCGGEIAPGSAPTSSNPACSSSNPACSAEYRSSRIQAMIEKKVEYERAADAEMEASKDTWSEVRERKVESDEQSSGVANKAFFRSLQEEYVGDSDGSFFRDWSDGRIELGEKIAEGAQGAIYTVSDLEGAVVKVFKLEGWSLEELHQTWSPGMLNFMKVQSKSSFNERGVAPIGSGLLLKDGSFGFVMVRFWGDLRKMIDLRMIHNGNRAPPFSLHETRVIMGSIVLGMMKLHKNDIVHGDLKAANVLVMPNANANAAVKVLADSNYVKHLEFDPLKDLGNHVGIVVADYECSGGVVGTGFWRAPEILTALKNHRVVPSLCTEKSDVYSFGMTCYEILTGKIPFEGVPINKYDIVLKGERPKLPSDTSPWFQNMLESCWHHEPSKRPSFQELSEKLGFTDLEM